MRSPPIATKRIFSCAAAPRLFCQPPSSFTSLFASLGEHAKQPVPDDSFEAGFDHWIANGCLGGWRLRF
jgi:hypothetical protein